MEELAVPISQSKTAGLMARMAQQDAAAFGEFVAEHQRALATIMRGHLASLGWRNAGPGEAHDLVMDAALELWRLAPAWRPDGGAAPWTWASQRLRALASSYLGQHCADLSEIDISDVTAPAALGYVDPEPLEVLARLARCHPLAARLQGALHEVACARDAAIFVDHLQETGGGNRRPAVTVAARWGISPAAVRKVVQRVRRRLRDVPAGDDGVSIGDLPAIRAAA